MPAAASTFPSNSTSRWKSCIPNARFPPDATDDLAGTEVDIVLESGGKLVPIEVKLSATPRPGMAASIRRLQKDLGSEALPGYVVHPGDVRLPLGEGVTALPFSDL